MNKRFTLLMTTLILSVFFSISASAYDVKVDGIYYNLNSKDNVAEVTNLGYGIYRGNITIPSSISVNEVEYPVTSIGDEAFYGCSDLKSVTIPNSVTSIGKEAFYKCSGLTSVTIPNSVTSIGSYAFYYCGGLKSVTIPNSVTSIGEYAFAYFYGLTSVTIPNSVTSIGSYAFYYCQGLTSVTISNSVTSIGDGAFKNCSYLTSINIPNSVTNIGEEAFKNCSYLTSITIPNSVTNIGDGAFSGCSRLTSVTIPNSVTSIGDGAFSGCSRLTSVTIPNSVTSIGKEAFSSCSGLTSITIPNSVTSIGKEAFKSCSGLTSVTIPNSVTSIGWNAFRGCSGLTSVTIPNSVKSIGIATFEGCSGLTSVTIPNSVTSIENYAFDGCSGLTSITIPNSVTSIGANAFYYCSNLTSIIIPNSVTSIGESAFQYCSALTSVTIPNSVTSIGKYTFGDCKINKLYYDCSIRLELDSYYLKELTIGDNIIVVEDYFRLAPLTKIVLGKNVTHIKPGAFSESNLEEFTITSEEPPYLYPNVFGTQGLSKATLYVPENKTEYYQTTKPWSKFGKILTLSGDTSEEPKKCATPSISYSDGQLQFKCDTEGAKCYYALNNSDVKTGETLAESNNVNLSACYDITCYAKAEGFVNSDVVTAKLYWLPSSGTLEGDNINNVSMRCIAIQSAGGFVTIFGLDNTETVSFYGIDGKSLGSATAINGTTSFAAQSGSIVVAKIGKENIKIAVK